MKLTGTIEERIQQAAEFGRAHRSAEYNEKQVEELYFKSLVPFSAAARKFWSDWAYVLDKMLFCSDKETIIDFSFSYFDDIGRLNLTYGPSKFNLSKSIREDFGDEAVPVAEGGYYYPHTLWQLPDGKLLVVTPDNESAYMYDTLELFLGDQLDDEDPSYVLVVTDSRELTGTIEERINAAINFAKEHGGFKDCYFKLGISELIDLKKLLGRKKHSDAEIYDILLKTLTEGHSDYCTFLTPEIIKVVE